VKRDDAVYPVGVLMLRHLEELAGLDEPLHLALGVFDGVHLGHRAVIAAAVQAARREGGMAGLLTFHPHPIRVIAPGKAPAMMLTTLGQKMDLAGGLGIEFFVALNFDAEMAAMEAADFLGRLCRAEVRTIAVGEDWRFGRGRSGDVAFLRAESQRHGYRLVAVPPVMAEGDRISSTRIRQAIRDGNLAAAERMLGRAYAVRGEVLKGARLGHQLGFPTANLAVAELQVPPDGVWAVRARINHGDWMPAVANLGLRPTVGGEQRLLEVHVLDFAKDLYGCDIEVEFLCHLRGERKFSGLDELKAAIARDVEAVRGYFAGRAES
jgi:riboflavin kinase/FMN adenylyltransferase